MNDFTFDTRLRSRHPDAVAPVLIAGKLESAHHRNGEEICEELKQEPRVQEILWFLQAVSMQPGSLAAYAEYLVNRYADELGSAELLALPDGKLTDKQLRDVWDAFPAYVTSGHECYSLRDNNPPARWMGAEEYDRRKAAWDEDWNARQAGWMEFYHSLTRERLLEVCAEKAMFRLHEHLNRYLSDNTSALGNPWFFARFQKVMLKEMNRHARELQQRLAPTAVVEKVFDGLDYAWAERVMVRIEGDSRFGKTESIETWCAMHPGRARLVTVPCSNADADFYRAIADALGIAYSFKSKAPALREAVEYVVRHAGLMLVFDEAHFLFPQRYSDSTPPMRLNWIRTNLIDRDMPCVIVATPQDYKTSGKRYVKKTGYTFAQWLGREGYHVTLPAELSQADMLAVARVHFPEINEPLLKVIVAAAGLSDAYLKAVENIARRARYLAGKAGRTSPGRAEVERAITETIPDVKLPRASEGVATPRQQADSVNDSRAGGAGLAVLKQPDRGTKDETITTS